MAEFQDLAGLQFGRLTVVARAENTKRGSARWNCICECGNNVVVDAAKLKSGHTKSCGCLRAEQNRTVALKHGLAKTRLHRIWMQIHARCNATHGKNYDWYASRGITVCDEWSDFLTFYFWAINNGYSDDLTIDRIDVERGYEPSNCRWVDLVVQANNKRNNFLIEYNGKRQTAPQWERETGINAKTLRYRVLHGWTAEKALTTPPRRQGG